MSATAIAPTDRNIRFIHFIRDGLRHRRGRPQKYTASQRPNYDFDNYTVSDQEWSLLSTLIEESAQHDGPIVEVGVLAGRTTQRIAVAKRPEQKILAVDNFGWNGWGLTEQEHWSLVQLSLGYLTATGQVEIHKIDKNRFYEEYSGPRPSLVFVDAMHDYEETKKDLLWAKSLDVPIICGHDYSDQFPGVQQIVDELGGPRQLAGTLFRL